MHWRDRHVTASRTLETTWRRRASYLKACLILLPHVFVHSPEVGLAHPHQAASAGAPGVVPTLRVSLVQALSCFPRPREDLPRHVGISTGLMHRTLREMEF